MACCRRQAMDWRAFVLEGDYRDEVGEQGEGLEN